MPISENKDELSYTACCHQANTGVRADKFLTEIFPELNRSQIRKAMDLGHVWVNQQVATKKQKFSEGDEVSIQIPVSPSLVPHAVDIPLDVVYEDDDIIIVNKSAGMVTHPGSGTGEDTLVHALLHHCNDKLSRINGEDRPGIVHRLDKETSGLIVAAKSDQACLKLLETFKSRELTKEYMALIAGAPVIMSGTICSKIGRHPTIRTKMGIVDSGREAITDWELVETGCNISLVKCRIYTGRTHQIRVHMSSIGYSIIGDVVYGYQSNRHPKVSLKPSRPMLHAWRLVFPHPISGEEMVFEVDLPKDFQLWLSRIR